jgi:hypothetical protein
VLARRPVLSWGKAEMFPFAVKLEQKFHQQNIRQTIYFIIFIVWGAGLAQAV